MKPITASKESYYLLKNAIIKKVGDQRYKELTQSKHDSFELGKIPEPFEILRLVWNDLTNQSIKKT
jgi:hypothetical protein